MGDSSSVLIASGGRNLGTTNRVPFQPIFPAGFGTLSVFLLSLAVQGFPAPEKNCFVPKSGAARA